MRLEKEITIQMDEKTSNTFKVFEVTPIEIRDILLQEGEGADPLALLKKIMPKLTNASFDEVASLPPSDQEKLWEGFKEVNRPFLKAAGWVKGHLVKLNLIEFVKNLIPAKLKDEFVNSLRQDMAELGITAFPSSLQPSKSGSETGQATGTD